MNIKAMAFISVLILVFGSIYLYTESEKRAASERVDASIAQRRLSYEKLFTGDIIDVERGISKDCNFRHNTDYDLERSCTKERKSAYHQMRNTYSGASRSHRAAIIGCVQDSKSMNDYEWDRVKWCYEREASNMR